MFRIIFLLSIYCSISFANIDPNEPDIYGTLPLGAAAKQGNLEDCEKLIASGAIVENSDNAGKTALHIAAYWGHLAVCKLLIDKKAPINAVDGYGETPLHHSASEGYAEICELLRAHGANPQITSQYNGKAIDMARRSNEDGSHRKVIECLLRDTTYSQDLHVKSATRRQNDCGSFNGTTCSASPGNVVWDISPLAFKYFKVPQIPCQDASGTLTCQWEQSQPSSFWIAMAPCIDFQRGKSWTGSFEIEIDFTAPPAHRDFNEYPAFALNLQIVTENIDQPIAKERIDLTQLPHDNWHWQLKKQIALSGSTENLPQGLKCVSLGVSGANRLRDSKLKGVVRIRNAKIGVSYEHPNSPVTNQNLNLAFIALRDDLLICPITELPYSTGCSLKEGTLKGSRSHYPIGTVIHIDYVHTCTGTPLSIGILLGDNQKAEFIADGSRNSVELTGNGPVMFKSFDSPEYLAKAIFVNPCTIRITGFHVRSNNELEAENDF